MPIIRPSLSSFSSQSAWQLTEELKALDTVAFGESLQQLFHHLNLTDEIPALLKSLTDSLSSYAVQYNLTIAYDAKCLSRTVGDRPEIVFADIPQEDFLVIFDLDETLAHVSKDASNDWVLFVRPMVHHVINLLAKSGIRLAVWTAAARSHALNALDIIDPEGKIEFVLHRDERDHHHCLNWSNDKLPEFVNTKALALLPGNLQARTILFDNSISSLAHPSSSPRSILVPDFKPTIGIDEEYYKHDRFWLNGLYLILHVYAKFKACLVHRSDTVDYLSSLAEDGMLQDSWQGRGSFLAIRTEYFPELSEFTLRSILKDIKFVPEGALPASEMLSCPVPHESVLPEDELQKQHKYALTV